MAEVLVKHGEIKQLANLFNVSRKTVYNALKTDRHTELCDRIRIAAIKRGGLIGRSDK